MGTINCGISDLPSGIYFLKAIIEGKVSTKIISVLDY